MLSPALDKLVSSADKSRVQPPDMPPANPESLKSEQPVTKFSKSSLVPSKFVSRHPVMRSAECSYRVMHEYSAARETSSEVCSQRHFHRVFEFPSELLVEFVAAFKRKNHMTKCRKISRRVMRTANMLLNGMMAGRTGINRDFPDNPPRYPRSPTVQDRLAVRPPSKQIRIFC